MNFKDFDLKVSYINIGEDAFCGVLSPLLKCTKSYKRSVGFFSSSALSFLGQGVLELAKNGGHIYLATSPKLSEQDIIAIQKGYEARAIIEERFFSEVDTALDFLDEENLQLLYALVKENILDIKVITKDNGMYHDKIWLLEDFEGNKLAFTGSANETGYGYSINYEKIRTYKGWNDPDGHVEDETNEIESIWNDSNEFLKVYDFKDAFEKKVFEYVERAHSTSKNSISLRKYQVEARDAWISNGYKGFFVMATGTGKTITSLFTIMELMKKEEVFTVIAVPYIHLVKQWTEDAKNILLNSEIIQVFGAHPGWDLEISNSLLYNLTHPKEKKNIVAITTLASFDSAKFDDVLKNVHVKRLLVVDEAHNFINKINDKKFDYEYKLGLSATPVFGNNVEKTNSLLNFFGGMVYNLPIEKVIGSFLVNYEYYPLFAHSNYDEEREFKRLSQKIRSCFGPSGELINKDGLISAHRARLRLISMCSEKIAELPNYISKIETDNHFIVYCSDGKIYEDNNEETKHLQYVLDVLNNKGYKPSKFTASEGMEDRIRLIEHFNDGDIDSLVAIRCLDEGINIPSIKTALILSSNDNYREFVQRRGRILRTYPGKKFSKIYDVIVLPSIDCPGLAAIELRRYYEYAKLAINKKELINNLYGLLYKYGLTMEDIMFQNSIDEENAFIEEENLDD